MLSLRQFTEHEVSEGIIKRSRSFSALNLKLAPFCKAGFMNPGHLNY